MRMSIAYRAYMKYQEDEPKMETIQIRLTKNMLMRLDELIQMGEYPNKSEAIRDSVRKMLEKNHSNEVLNISVKDLQKFIKSSLE